MTKKEQVASAIRRLIAIRHWKIGDSLGDLWALEQMSEELFGIHVSWGTVRAAQEILVGEGLLSPVRPGMPTRVIALPPLTDEDPTTTALRAIQVKLADVCAEVAKLLGNDPASPALAQ